jgi:hypothetical protein
MARSSTGRDLLARDPKAQEAGAPGASGLDQSVARARTLPARMNPRPS